MGNQTSSLKIDNDKLLKKTVNAIAAKYILTQNFQDMISLKDPENCSNLVIITSEVIKESLNWRSILYLDQFLKGNKVINKMAKENLLYLNKGDLNDLDIENSVDKKRMCIGISKFYIKINMLFSAITTTIRPVVKLSDEDYDDEDQEEHQEEEHQEEEHQEEKHQEEEDQEEHQEEDQEEHQEEHQEEQQEEDQGEQQKEDQEEDQEEDQHREYELENRDLLLGNTKVTVDLSPDSLCGKRIISLMNKNTYEASKKSYTINPNLCSFFVEQDGKNLYQEPGIPELEALFKDNFNYQTGNLLDSLTNESRNQYQDAINILYKAFTGKQNKINSITKRPEAQQFSDIKLQNYDIADKCDEDGVYTQIFKGNSPIFREYVKRIQKMINDNKNYNLQLVQILKQVFKIDKTQSPYVVTLNPSLDEIKLDLLIEQTRKIF